MTALSWNWDFSVKHLNGKRVSSVKVWRRFTHGFFSYTISVRIEYIGYLWNSPYLLKGASFLWLFKGSSQAWARLKFLQSLLLLNFEGNEEFLILHTVHTSYCASLMLSIHVENWWDCQSGMTKQSLLKYLKYHLSQKISLKHYLIQKNIV